MLREIIIPENSLVTVQLPEEMVGKTVELIAFEIEPRDKPDTNNPDKEKELERIRKITAPYLTDLSNFKFNRDEANNYDE
jgi:hypothetical protein